MSKLKILNIHSISDERYHQTWDPIIDYSRFHVIRPSEQATEEDMCDLIKDVDILMTDPSHFRPVTKKMIESGEYLRLILCPTIGYDEVDLEAARENGIPVVNSAGISAKPMAEYVIMAAIHLLKHIKLMDSEFQERRWSKSLLVGPRQPRELGLQTIGIIGCGSVGQQVARLAKVIGSKIVYHNRRRLPEELEDELGIEFVSLDTLLGMSDVVSVNVPLTDETRGMISVDELAKMKERAILINTARGGIVDERALANAIETGHLGGAAVDAFDNEPNIQECPLIGLENVLLTPHMCSRSPELIERVGKCVKENLDNLYEGRALARLVN
jgi:phosphoglycerate dehydrogenase-like enzyme